MKSFTIVASIALASVATAQLSSIPACALNCFLTPLGSDGCKSLDDFGCHCKSADSLFASVIPCVQKACASSDQAATIKATEKICSDAGVPIQVPSVSRAAASSAAASSTAAPSVSSAAPVSSAAASSSAAAVTSVASAFSSAVKSSVSAVKSSASAAASTIATSTSEDSTVSSTTPTASQFTGAAAHATHAAGIIGAAAVAFLAL